MIKKLISICFLQQYKISFYPLYIIYGTIDPKKYWTTISSMTRSLFDMFCASKVIIVLLATFSLRTQYSIKVCFVFITRKINPFAMKHLFNHWLTCHAQQVGVMSRQMVTLQLPRIIVSYSCKVYISQCIHQCQLPIRSNLVLSCQKANEPQIE